MMKPFLIVLIAASAVQLYSCKFPASEPQRTVRFVVTTDTLAANSVIYISGNHPDLGEWEADRVRLYPDSGGNWNAVLEFPQGTALEYKLTLGSWESEAIDEAGLELPNAHLEVRSDTTIRIHIKNWKSPSSSPSLISPIRFRNKAGAIELFRGWSFHAGDDPRWASPDFNDRDWPRRDSRLLASEQVSQEWQTIGWFRMHLTIDSALFGRPVAFQISQLGASEVFLNGERVFTIGEVSADPAKVRPQRDLAPKVLVLPRQRQQLLAVRFANARMAQMLEAARSGGFSIILGDDPNAAITSYASTSRSATMQQWGFGVIPVVLAFMHFLLFVFYPAKRENLYYALSMLGWTGIIYTSFQQNFYTDPLDVLFLPKLSAVAISAALAFGMLTAYGSTRERIPRPTLVLAAIAFALALAGTLIYGSWISYAYDVLIGLAAIEMVRALFRGGLKRERATLIVGIGSMILMVSVVLQVLIGLGVLTEVLGTTAVYMYGVLALSLAVSIDLSRSVARSNRDLKQQIVQIKGLSERALEQERRAKEEELNRRLLEADNRRKTQELEEARAVQLSMLPRELPVLRDLEIAAFMQPANEVGGDYYDFHVRDDGTLTLAIGDATGHGARAGMMVTVTKSLFRQLAIEADVLTMLTRYNESIRSLNLTNLYMAMAIGRISGRTLHVAGAGMPPLLIYRADQGTVERVPLKGMPLGSTLDFPYQQQTITLERNDLVLFMSDGFPELSNARGQQVEYEGAEALFRRVAAGSPQSVVDAYVAEARSWTNGGAFNDDLTFVAVKVKAS